MNMRTAILFLTAIPTWVSIVTGLMAFGLGASTGAVLQTMAFFFGLSAWLVGLAILEAGAEAVAPTE